MCQLRRYGYSNHVDYEGMSWVLVKKDPASYMGQNFKMCTNR